MQIFAIANADVRLIFNRDILAFPPTSYYSYTYCVIYIIIWYWAVPLVCSAHVQSKWLIQIYYWDWDAVHSDAFCRLAYYSSKSFHVRSHSCISGSFQGVLYSRSSLFHSTLWPHRPLSADKLLMPAEEWPNILRISSCFLFPLNSLLYVCMYINYALAHFISCMFYIIRII